MIKLDLNLCTLLKILHFYKIKGWFTTDLSDTHNYNEYYVTTDLRYIIIYYKTSEIIKLIDKYNNLKAFL